MTEAMLFVAVLLLAGVVLRVRFAIFRWLYIPASVIAGLLGLVIVQTAAMLAGAEPASAPVTSQWAETLRSWPGWLIAVVFAGMLMQRRPPSLGVSLRRVGRQGLMVWIIVVGETAVGLLATWLLIRPWYDVPHSLGMLIETGFAGGHATAAAMGQVFAHPSINLPTGLDLGMLMATCGLIYGIVSGLLWVNLGVRAGWIPLRHSSEEPAATASDRQLDEPSDRRQSDSADGQAPAGRPIGHAVLDPDTIDPLLLQAIWLALAFAIGLALQWLVGTLATGFDEAFLAPQAEPGGEAGAELSPRPTLGTIVGSFPLFIYTLFGGLLVRLMLRLAGREEAIDRGTLDRLTSTAMDLLVVAAIASLNITAVVPLLVPLSILFLCGAAWTAVCLLVIARWVLPEQHWFQLGLINYGMSTGTTATGFVLLRMVDPHLESGAAEDYALAVPLSAPFIGGGMITFALPLLVLEQVPIWIPAVALMAFVGGLVILGRIWKGAEESG